MRNELEKAADSILSCSTIIAHKNYGISQLKDKLEHREAVIRAKVSTEINDATGKLRWPNIDAQNAEVIVELCEITEYVRDKKMLAENLRDLEIQKAKLLRMHEQRRDLRTEAELQAALLA